LVVVVVFPLASVERVGFARGGAYAGFWAVVGYALAILPRAM
jgi:hypothetical protein